MPLPQSIILQTDQVESVITNYIPFPFKTDHPDILWINQDQQGITIDTIRQLHIWSIERPYQAEQKVVILLNAESANPVAQNALLKLLEEPANYLHLRLITAFPFLLLPTIRSRCILIQEKLSATNLHDFTQITQMTLAEKLEWVEQFQHREQAIPIIMSFIYQALEKLETQPSLSLIHDQRILVKTLEQLQANTHIKLALENCLLQLQS